MAAFSQISQKKRGRDEYLNSGLDSLEAKRSNRGMLRHDCNLMAVLDKIDNAGNINTNPEDTHTTMNDVEGEMKLNVVTHYLEDEIGLKTRRDNSFQPTYEMSSTEYIGSNKQGKLTADGESGRTAVMFDTENFPYYDDACGDLRSFLDHFTLDEHGIPKNHLYGDSTLDIMYLDAVQSYVEAKEDFFWSIWEDDIGH